MSANGYGSRDSVQAPLTLITALLRLARFSTFGRSAHGCGGASLRRGLLREYGERLGLTATLERADDGVTELLLPYFGGICHRYGFEQAIADGVCARPRVAFVGVAREGSLQPVDLLFGASGEAHRVEGRDPEPVPYDAMSRKFMLEEAVPARG